MRASPGPVPLVRVVRSGIEESIHTGSIAIVDPDGAVVWRAGDPSTLVFARSSIKPFQASISVELVDEELSDREVAVMCASHNGEPVHLEAVGSILGRAGLGTEALRCPPSLPLDPTSAREVEGPRPELHNCSGKHAGMLLACARQGWDLGGYLGLDHPLQDAILSRVAGAAGRPAVAVGVDGCGAPVPAFQLRALARAFAGLGQTQERGLRRAVGAMRAEPYMVAGRDRLCTELMRIVPGLVAKVGAEGLLCLGLLDRGMGIAIKTADGATRAHGPAAVHVLTLLGALEGVPEGSLDRWARPPVLGGGKPAGALEPMFRLEH